MEISEFRERMRDYVTGDQASLDDEEWWEQTTELSLLVLAERARVKREKRHDVETHRFSFEGSTTLLADHLTNEHALPPNTVNRWRGGLTQGDWVALDELHRGAHQVRQQPEPTPPRAHKDWGVAWFGKNGESGTCERCHRATRVYQGYNEYTRVGKFCNPCQLPVLRSEA